VAAAAGRSRRDRLIQLGFVVVAVALVAVGDAVAARVLAAAPGPGGRALHALLLIGGRVVGGWSVGLAFRMQLARTAAPDVELRRLLAIPLAVVCAWPVLLALLPAGAVGVVPSPLRSGPAVEVQPFAAAVLGLVLALSVRPKRR
jgi:hypothetical protein